MTQTTGTKTDIKVLLPLLFLVLTGCGGDTAIQELAEPEAVKSVTLPSSLVITLPQSSSAQSSIVQGVLAKALEGSASSFNYKCMVFELDENGITFAKKELPSEGVKVTDEGTKVRLDYDPDTLLENQVIGFVVEDPADPESEIPISISGEAVGATRNLDMNDNQSVVEAMLENKEHQDALKGNVDQLREQGLQSVAVADINNAMSVLIVAIKQFKESGEVFKFDGAAYHELDVFKDLAKSASALKNNPFALARFVEVQPEVLEKRLSRFEVKAETWASEFNGMMTKISDAPEIKDLLAEPAKMFTQMSNSGTGKLAFMGHVEKNFIYGENYFDANKYVDRDVATQVGFSAPAAYTAFNFSGKYQTAQTAVLAQAAPASLTTIDVQAVDLCNGSLSSSVQSTLVAAMYGTTNTMGMTLTTTSTGFQFIGSAGQTAATFSYESVGVTRSCPATPVATTPTTTVAAAAPTPTPPAPGTAGLSISNGPTYSYGSVTAGTQYGKSFTISNIGSVSATTISAASLGSAFVFVGAGGTFPGTGGTCGSTLASGANCTAMIMFAPIVAGTTYNATFTINYNNGNAVTSTSIGLTGMGSGVSGSLDSSFGTSGKVLTANLSALVSDGGDIPRRPMAIQSDGKIVVGGVLSSDFALARYTSTGVLDTTFGTNGAVTTQFSTGDAVYALAIQSDGKIIAAGTDGPDLALARYNTNGSLDTSFDTDGKVTTNAGGTDRVYALAIQSDGKIVAAGTTGTDFALARYNADGSLDTDFDTDGKVTSNVGGATDAVYALAIQSDGKIIAAGTDGGDFALMRYSGTNGSVDAGFGGSGVTYTNAGGGTDKVYALAIQSDGKIVAAGTNGFDFALARYNADGSSDTTFSDDGLVTTSLGTTDRGYALAIQSDGKFIVAGAADSNFGLVRYTSTGALDTDFDTDGMVTTDFEGGTDVAHALAIQSDGRIVLIGTSVTTPAALVIARYWP